MLQGAIGVVVAAALAGGCAHAAPAPSLRLRPCGAASDRAECGWLDVPEDPVRPRGHTIRLAVTVLRADQPRPGAPPLYHLDGGPGVAASGARSFYSGPGRLYRRYHDLVLVDQRGTGQSGALRCPDIEARGPLEEQYTGTDVDRCRNRLAARADLTHYGTADAAADLDRVRAALGHDRIDLWALSYGTQLAQIYLRAFPGRVRRAVLVGTAPLDFATPLHHAEGAQRVIDKLFAACRADAACHGAFPQLEDSWRLVLAGVARTGPAREAIRRLLGTTTSQRGLPLLIDRAARGDSGPLLAALRGGPDPVAEGLYLSNACAEGTLRISPTDSDRFTRGTFLGDYRIRNQLAACRRWPVRAVAPSFVAPVRSPAAVLVLAGGMDATTSPEGARQVCAALGNCRFIEVADLAHAPFDLDRWQEGDCLDRIAAAFFDQPRPAPLDTGCLARMHPPPFDIGR